MKKILSVLAIAALLSGCGAAGRLKAVGKAPGMSQTGGLRKAPLPAGVPVAITSPGSRVMNPLMYSMSRSTGNSMSAVLPCCIGVSLTT